MPVKLHESDGMVHSVKVLGTESNVYVSGLSFFWSKNASVSAPLPLSVSGPHKMSARDSAVGLTWKQLTPIPPKIVVGTPVLSMLKTLPPQPPKMVTPRVSK